MSDLEEFECSCEKCIAMCQGFPCRPLPSEVREMPNDVAARLMIRDDGDSPFSYLQAAGVGYEGKDAPDFDSFCGHVNNPQTCTFQTEDGLCELHGKCKPWEGRVTVHGDEGAGMMEVCDRLEDEWGSDLGKDVLHEWREEFCNLEPMRE
jgi:hypothetical protein